MNPSVPVPDPLVALRQRLVQSGFSLCHPFAARWVNGQLAPAQQLALAGYDDPLALLIGNDKTLWPKFIAALRADETLLALPNPLDSWVVHTLEHDVAVALAHTPHQLHWAHVGPPYLPFQQIATLSGFAALSPAQLCVHPSYGPWFALRAAIVLGFPAPPGRAPTISLPCHDCKKRCEPALAEALRGLGEQRPNSSDVVSRWERWLAVRDACPAGRDARYGDDQLRYHYTRDRHFLRLLATRSHH